MTDQINISENVVTAADDREQSCGGNDRCRVGYAVSQNAIKNKRPIYDQHPPPPPPPLHAFNNHQHHPQGFSNVPMMVPPQHHQPHQQCYPLPPFFMHPTAAAAAVAAAAGGGTQAMPSNDSQFYAFPSTHIGPPVFLFDGKTYSFVPAANILPHASANFANIDYFVNQPPPMQHSYRSYSDDGHHSIRSSIDRSTQVDSISVPSESDGSSDVDRIDDSFSAAIQLTDESHADNEANKEDAEKDQRESPDAKLCDSLELAAEPTDITDSFVPEEKEQARQVTPQPVEEKKDNKVNGEIVARKSWASLFTNERPRVVSKEVTTNDSSVKSRTIKPRHRENDTVSKQHDLPVLGPALSPGEFSLLTTCIRDFSMRNSAPALNLRGFHNEGNFCYVNAALQALLACPMFYNFIDSLPPIPKDKSTTANAPTAGERRYPLLLFHLKCIFDNISCMFRNSSANNSGAMNGGSKTLGGISNSRPDQGNGQTPLKLAEFHESCGVLMRKQSSRRQEDSHEFMCRLLQELHQECMRLQKSIEPTMDEVTEPESSQQVNGNQQEDPAEDEDEWRAYYGKRVHIHREVTTESSPISEIFAGVLRTSLERGSGLMNSSNLEPFYILSLDVDHSTVSAALKAFCSKVPVNGLSHPQTKRPTKALHTTSMERLPPCLILHMKCYSFVTQTPKKLFSNMVIQVDLPVPPELLSKTCCTTAGSRQYKLFAVIRHHGSSSTSGHYTCDVFHPGLKGWLRCDDHSISQVSSRDVVCPTTTTIGNGNGSKSADAADSSSSSSCPFMLFYRQK